MVLKAGLDGRLPYELLNYAAKHPVFPRDSTSDRWFDHGQFDAYQALGRHLGEQAARAETRRQAPAQQQPSPTVAPAPSLFLAAGPVGC